jgi:hypothetical protein
MVGFSRDEMGLSTAVLFSDDERLIAAEFHQQEKRRVTTGLKYAG